MIDRDALIETVAEAIYDDENWGKEQVAEKIIATVARELLAPLRVMHGCEIIAVHEGYGAESWCAECKHHYPCPTTLLLDQIEADVKKGEN